MSLSQLTDIVQESREVKEEIEKVKRSDINNYIVELIRISKMYKFHAKIKPKNNFAQIQNKMLNPQINLDQKSNSIKEEDEKQENKQYLNLDKLDIIDVSYDKDRVIVKNIVYKVQKPKIRPQELWEKEGFYQERPAIAKVKVQLWPEHLPYDHFKRKRAFLFC
jgi:hypothetical protein|tara:strand:- start:36 stop:527 length:492 start_codon:yes stop_codon:yes gene_type:complete